MSIIDATVSSKTRALGELVGVAGSRLGAYAGWASPARNLIESISDDDNSRTTRMGASSEAPAFFLAASTALSAEPIATLKNWKDGEVFMAGRHRLPSIGTIGTPGIVN
jgi:hypothetical protein